MLIVTHDVTELRQVEKQLEIHALITSNLSDGICVTRAADGIILYTNPKLEQIFGYAPCELIGEKVSLLHYGSNLQDLQEKVSEVIDRTVRQSKLTYERHSVKKNGQDFWCSVRACSLHHPRYGTVLLETQSEIEFSPTACSFS